jgi:hypothetical protein
MQKKTLNEVQRVRSLPPVCLAVRGQSATGGADDDPY